MRTHDDIVLAYKKGYRVVEGKAYFNGRPIKLQTHSHGYLRFGIKDQNGKLRHIMVHRMVAYHKFGSKMFVSGIQVRHLDGNIKNNFEHNIAIGTGSENMMDIPEEKRVARAKYASSFAQKHNHSKIVKAHESGKSYNQIMKKFKISSKGTVSFIIQKSIKARENEKNNL